jgi:microcystin-dependent protein
MGVTVEPGGLDGRGGSITVAQLELYETTRVESLVFAAPVPAIEAGFGMPYFGPITKVDEPIPGWVVFDGRNLSRTKYPSLFAKFGEIHGAGDGSTTFGTPDLRGRIPVNLDNSGGTDAGRLSVANTLGGTGGEEKHTLTMAELPTGVLHQIPSGGSTGYNSTGAGRTADENASGGAAHNTMPPYMLVNWLIKT